MKNKTSNKKLINSVARVLLTATMLICSTLYSRAQLNPFQSMYFQNKYLYNPAMAGVERGLDINIDYMQQWNTFPGMPKTGSFTADFQPAEKVGLGISVYNEEAGLIRTTRIIGTYAYHLPLSDQNEHLNFGVSMGINDSRVNYDNINGDATDPEIAQYNHTSPYADGDFGIAYTSNNLYIGGAVPNLRSDFFKTSDIRFDADRLLFIAVASYKIPIKNDVGSYSLEPMAAYRVVQGYKDIVDAGFNFTMNDYGLYLQGIYHSNQTMGLGVGFDQQTYAFSFSYNLETGQLSNYAVGTFELGLKIKLPGK
jgi:type IX secretion system PorP/SprF family membrane protein